MKLDVVILAAGNGSRMQSELPKVLHPIAGEPMLSHVIKTAQKLNPHNIFVVYGYKGDIVKASFDEHDIHWVYQAEQLGTGHAVLQALEFIDDTHRVLIVSADVPLLSENTLQALLNEQKEAPIALLTADVPNPFGLGRIIRDKNLRVEGIVEEKDASSEQKTIQEIYSGIMVAKASELKRWLPKLTIENAQKELYLTSIVELVVHEEDVVSVHKTTDVQEVYGINDRVQLQRIEREFQKRMTERLMRQGVTISDSMRVDVRGELDCGKDVFIDVNALFEGKVILDDGVSIGPNCVIKNAHIKKNATVLANSMVDESIVGEHSCVGPFARLRPGTLLNAYSKVGNFVEMKKTTLGEGAKVNHLSYIGDSTIGRDVNIGAGTITCNYDGVNKHKTVIEAGAFIGSGTELVAPVHVGKNATIGAGTTLRKNAPADKLTLSLKAQKTVENWERPEGDRG